MASANIIGNETISGVVLREAPIFTAAIIMVWDIEPSGSKPWKLPNSNRRFGIRRPANDIRVCIKQRS